MRLDEPPIVGMARGAIGPLPPKICFRQMCGSVKSMSSTRGCLGTENSIDKGKTFT
jgi:hypothetical protein